MQPTGVKANLTVPDIAQARGFYTDYLGLSVEEFDLGWVARFRSPDGRAVVQLVTRDATAPYDAAISVHTDDVDAAYEEARQRGYEIVHPLTTEPWGIRRFLVRAPDGNVINVNSHRESGHVTVVSVSELKAQLSRYLREVRAGGEVRIVDRGRPVARLFGLAQGSDARGERTRLVADGFLRPGNGRLLEVLEEPTPRIPVDLSGALREEREDRV